VEVTVVRPKVMAISPGRISGYVLLTAEGRVLSAGYALDPEDIVGLMEEFLPEELVTATKKETPGDWMKFASLKNELASLFADYAEAVGIRVTVYHEDWTAQFPVRARWEEVNAAEERIRKANPNLPQIGHVSAPLRLAVAHLLENGTPVA